ncbi:alpha/beta fold hydrolase [Herminiimonas arsenitoxidans]|uniref:alpha/beta fold hydrolase n=1 Tax=Herminiimonas arsenitoxidans TaxID=1809410 RepID=UPI000970E7EB|nr:alpha/beta hydrolase [Herminiimonas arsenitoxidans]
MSHALSDVIPAAIEDASLPQWYRTANRQPGISAKVEVDGIELHYLSWQSDDTESKEDTAKPVLLFLHGFRAHAHWWDFIAPFFTDNYRVLAMDFSGMGDSGHRTQYDLDTFAADITGLIEALDIGPVIGVGHSYGGSRLLRACAERPDLFQHAVVIDSYILFSGDTPPSMPHKLLGTRTFSDFNEACARYHLMPEQPAALAFLVDHIARHALRKVDGGWRWKFDPDMPATGYREQDGEGMLSWIRTPVDYICGEYSTVVSAERAARTVKELRAAPRAATVRGPIAIPQGQHHLMLDQPLALISTLRALLADVGSHPLTTDSSQQSRKLS